MIKTVLWTFWSFFFWRCCCCWCCLIQSNMQIRFVVGKYSMLFANRNPIEFQWKSVSLSIDLVVKLKIRRPFSSLFFVQNRACIQYSVARIESIVIIASKAPTEYSFEKWQTRFTILIDWILNQFAFVSVLVPFFFFKYFFLFVYFLLCFVSFHWLQKYSLAFIS